MSGSLPQFGGQSAELGLAARRRPFRYQILGVIERELD